MSELPNTFAELGAAIAGDLPDRAGFVFLQFSSVFLMGPIESRWFVGYLRRQNLTPVLVSSAGHRPERGIVDHYEIVLVCDRRHVVEVTKNRFGSTSFVDVTPELYTKLLG